MYKSLLTGLALALFALSGCRGDDGDKGVEPGGSDGGAPGVDAQPESGMTVADIKKEVVGDGEAVLLREVVVTAVDGYGDYSGDVYVQDPEGGEYSGIKLYKNSRRDGGEVSSLKPGDRVRVEGTVKHWSGTASSSFPEGEYVVELENNTIWFVSDGESPRVSEVTAEQLTQKPDALKWEGALVRVKDVAVVSPPHEKYKDFKVTGGLAVDDDLFPYVPKIGDCISVTGISVYFYDYRLNPRSDADIEAGSGCRGVRTSSIRELQDASGAERPALNSVVKVSGVVSAVDGNPSSKGVHSKFFIQDGTGAFSGIMVYHTWTEESALRPEVGDEVELTGTLVEYPAEKADDEVVTELKDVSWDVIGTREVPEPFAVSAADIATNGPKAEELEGVLVRVEDFEVAEIIQDKKGNPVALKGKSGLIVDYAFFNFFSVTEPAEGDVYTSIVGPLDFTYRKTRVYPRSADDMVLDNGSVAP